MLRGLVSVVGSSMTSRIAGPAFAGWRAFGTSTGPDWISDHVLRGDAGRNLQAPAAARFRPEVRGDWSDRFHPFNEGKSSSQLTFGFDAIVLF